MKALYIDKNGVVRYMPDCPDRPEQPSLAYFQLLDKAKESAIKFVDQLQVKQIMFERFCIFPKEYQDRHDTIIPFPQGYEVEVKEKLSGFIGCGSVVDKVAVITHRQKEEKEHYKELYEQGLIIISELEKEKDQQAIEFASYMQSEAWEHDYREQKTHTLREHLDYFKAIYDSQGR